MRYRIEVTSPAAAFEDGFPLGNGALGALLHGRPHEEWIDLNADTLWSGGPRPAPTGTVPPDRPARLRAAIAAGDHARADALARELQGPAWTQSYQPIGRLHWRYARDGPAGGYRRWLDLAEAVAVTSGDGAVLTSFVSAPDDVLVMSATGPDVEPHPPTLDCPHPGVVATGGDIATWSARVPAHVLPNYVDAGPAVVYGDGMGFAVAAAVQRDGDGVRLVAAVETGFRGPDRAPSGDLAALAERARAKVAAVLPVPTAELRGRHRADHRALFDRADLELPGAPEAERLFHLGRYLLIASSRPGTQAANLQGIWNADVRPGWSCNWTLNINAQMNSWAAESTGLPELHGPLLALARDLATAGQATARRCYGARGAAVHHNTDLWRFTAPVPGDPQWANWPSALPWLAAHTWDHLDFGGTDRDTALAVHRAAAAFTLDMLVADPSGALVVSPSTSPEHRFRYAAAGDRGDGVTAVSWGCALDQELAREVLTRFVALVAGAGSGSEDAGLAREATAALGRLRPVQVGAGGALLEWYDERAPEEPGHRHLSHLYGLYPGTRITDGDPHLAAARAALAERLAHGTGHTGWSRAWVLALAARLRDPGLAGESIRGLLDGLCSASQLTLHPDAGRPSGWIFQIDGNLGVVAGLAELLVQGHGGRIVLLPALPPGWEAGAVRGLRVRGGHRVDLRWAGGALAEAAVTAGAAGPLRVELPGGGLVELEAVTGQTYRVG